MGDDVRTTRLTKRFKQTLDGAALTRKTYPLFLEALRARDPADCISRLAENNNGLQAIQGAMRFDTSDAFLNGGAAETLAYFQAPELESVGGGALLQQVLRAISEPPIFWKAFLAAFLDGRLNAPASHAFAWLLLQLCRLPGALGESYIDLARGDKLQTALTTSDDNQTRLTGQKIKNLVETCDVVAPQDADLHPGGRHDNDHPDFRKIAILPTADEVASTEPPFLRRYRPLAESEEAHAVAECLDGQFRLLREDMLYEIKEELQIAFGKKKGQHRGLMVEGFKLLEEVFVGSTEQRGRLVPWGITLQALQDLWVFKKYKVADQKRRQWIDDNKTFFKHQSYVCLLVNDEVVGFPTISRDENRLARKPPVIVLQLPDRSSTIRTLVKLRERKNPRIKLIQIDTAIFSYEPVLSVLKEMRGMPLARELLCWSPNKQLEPPNYLRTSAVVDSIRRDPRQDLSRVLGTTKSIILDESQASSLLDGLTQRVSLIQGPPGTGKSFIGALLARIQEQANRRILVVCYTNHALDQFLEDILDMGVPSDKIVRLGGKSTARTESLSLQNQTGGSKLARSDYLRLDETRQHATKLSERLTTSMARFASRSPNVLEFLEFEEETFYDALTVPDDEDGMQHVGSGGKKIDRWYLLNRWESGADAGVFKNHSAIIAATAVWQMDRMSRKRKVDEWRAAIRNEQADAIANMGSAYNDRQRDFDRTFRQRDALILQTKQVIGCTTTGAAKYAKDLRDARLDVLIVEEAGEILESHVITALGDGIKQVILIGDHKQLRPKVNNYELTVEKGRGYELNRSMFERLVREGYPHRTLKKQHRMRPEISAFIRELTYPDLIDAPSTSNRPNLRGVCDNLVFIEHEKPEDDDSRIQNQQEGGSKSSKRNRYEAQMVLKIVKYLGQQGYGTDKLVVLTPYLGQLSELRDALKTENDPVLNDLDSYDLVKAGLIPASSANVSKNKLRLATIDNYQGEESDIVISSLTRSNSAHDIGFMFAPERLNVLLSRPRNAHIMIGNPDTFIKSRKGHELWSRFFDMMKAGGHIYNGLPVKCERHPHRTAILAKPDEFATECPDGGCTEPCGVKLSCGIHQCPSKCHQLADHSKMRCTRIVDSKCPASHPRSWECSQGPPASCRKCDQELKAAEEKQKRDFELQQKREAAQIAYAKKLADIDAQMAAQKQALQEAELEAERQRILEQKQQDLENLMKRVKRGMSALFAPKAPPPPPPAPAAASSPTSPSPAASGTTGHVSGDSSSANPTQTQSETLKIPESPARTEWTRQKNMEGADEPSIDAVMSMIGLEEVKNKLLDIKALIDTATRQGMSLKKERFNVTFLGNPGTGKTTVARHYAKFLAHVGVIPGSEFVETTGSRLSNDGVPGTKKMLEGVLGAGGGVIFVDEAYQLMDPMGAKVLDFLLAEMENNVGSIVFIFAGYAKQMEVFFEHNPGLSSRVPHTFKFADYSDAELLGIFAHLVRDRFKGQAKVEDGVDGLYARVAVRRLGRGRGSPGFGNARALENLFSEVKRRQAARLTKQRAQGLRPDDFVLTKEDMIGPDPSVATKESKAWGELQKMIGLQLVKESVQNLLDIIDTNYKRELAEKEPIQVSLNQVFFGNPGTGKTTVAKLYGQILADIGMISKGEVVVKNPSDFVGDVLGASEKQTKQILASTVGKVLVIDEAYMLYNGSGLGGAGSQSDPFKTAVIDTIVAEVQSNPGDDRCVLLLGYEDKMLEMFQNVNPGLSRRFNIESAFRFEDFNAAELLQVLELKLKSQHLDASQAGKQVAIDVLSRASVRPNFGNGGEVENLLGLAKKRFQSRQSKLPRDQRSSDVVLEAGDFDPDFERSQNATNNIVKLFEDVVGSDHIVKRLSEYQTIASVIKQRGGDVRSQIPTNWVFTGPPGTGKTTVARKMGQVYYDMGFLSSAEVEECSASDLVGQYVGQTGPKTTKLLDKALGRVLFIDEAYRLQEGQFAKEAIDELVGLLTQKKYFGKLVVILAGYTEDMSRLLAVNSGLASRFPESLDFPNIAPPQCLTILKKDLEKNDVELDESTDGQLLNLIAQMAQTRGWGNARDMKTVAKAMCGIAMLSASTGDPHARVKLDGAQAVTCMKKHLAQLVARSVQSHSPAFTVVPPAQTLDPGSAPNFATRSSTKAATPPPPPPEEEPQERVDEADDGRDAGVSDAVWLQLQADKQAEELQRRARAEAIAAAEQELREAEEREAQAKRELEEAERLAAQAQQQREIEEMKRRLERLRIKELMERRARERQLEELERKRKAEQEERKKEAQVQAKLRSMGVCVAGFRWIKQSGGYRCAGGSHYISDAQLGM
ncbi:hypothetical protein HMN09_00417100 [Mycena chlorophos]|uniref:AAA+ ATPase domain-containing protein n=1 Tax=Mycena chlorophos TaxID=658473 RepID=A0A8H6TFM9_MYCCL|nr:hypothetical protein HMN09_00417100 [Mycena chlorophos]